MNLPLKNSIKKRVIFQVTGLITTAMVLIITAVAYMVYQNMSYQASQQLKLRATAMQKRLEQRIQYLTENTELLSKNKFMINAFIDVGGRKTYLPPLVKNYMLGKDVHTLSVVDFDGKAIFQTQQELPTYQTSTELRSALALGRTTLFIQNNLLVVVAPIKFYDTTQGSIIVSFGLEALSLRNKPEDASMFFELIRHKESIFTYNYNPKERYFDLTLTPNTANGYLGEIALALRVGMPVSKYLAPVEEAVIRLLLLGALFIILSIIVALYLANSITNPIVELYRRVKASDASKDRLCSPIGTDDEIEALAQAFDERSLQLQYQAEHDALTQLPNRLLFLDRLSQAIKYAHEENNKLAVLFLDLDRFKVINDSLGHHIGDELLKEVGELLEKTLRHADTIARMGGDEFIILIDRIASEDLLLPMLETIIEHFQQPHIVQKHQLYITCSIGIAIYPDHGLTIDALMKNADAAMYKAKNEGRNTYQFYTADMTQRAVERIKIETELRTAVANNQLQVFFQPQIDMMYGQLVGMEALIRWFHPTMGMVAPNLFIPLAEENGMIVEIDRWMMQKAMETFSHWLSKGYRPGILSMNLSMIQLNHSDFLDFLIAALNKFNISAHNISFEITETQIMKNPEMIIRVLNNMQNLGIALAIDDFGTGQSSLSYLKKLPVNKLKIDQSFVRDIPQDKEDVELIHTIIAMAQNLQLSTIAEGVETKEQAELLMNLGCYEAQGYYYFKPMSAKDLEAVLLTQWF